MRILLDCDGVMADFVGGYLATLQTLDGITRRPEDVTRYKIEEALGLSSAAAAWVSGQIAQASWCYDLIPIKGAVEGVERLRALGHDLVVVTSPWRGHMSWHAERVAWLNDYFGIDERDVIFAARKEMITGELLVEDKPTILDSWKWGVPVLFDQPYNRHAALRRANWATLVEGIARMDLSFNEYPLDRGGIL